MPVADGSRTCESTAGCCRAWGTYRLQRWGSDTWFNVCGRHLSAMTRHVAGPERSSVLTEVLG